MRSSLDRHVIIPKALVKYLPTDRLAEEDEWRGLGIRQSPGWEHYLRYDYPLHEHIDGVLIEKRDWEQTCTRTTYFVVQEGERLWDVKKIEKRKGESFSWGVRKRRVPFVLILS